MKKLLIILASMLSLFPVYSDGAVASTSWIASYMDLAGIDDVTVIAPSSLRHPPEYELKPSDVATLMDADLFCYGGYEGMMKTIGDNITSPDRIDLKVNTGNSIENIKKETEKIAEVAGTEVRLDEYIAFIGKAREKVASSPIKDMKVLCHKMQLPLATDLGLDVVGTFGPASPSAEEILSAVNGDYDIIIDNVHNPVASPIAEVTDAEVVIWRNFPESTGHGALLEMVKGNVENLFAIL